MPVMAATPTTSQLERPGRPRPADNKMHTLLRECFFSAPLQQADNYRLSPGPWMGLQDKALSSVAVHTLSPPACFVLSSL